MGDNRNFQNKGQSGKSGLALLASIKLSKRDKFAWWALLAAGIVLAVGCYLRA